MGASDNLFDDTFLKNKVAVISYNHDLAVAGDGVKGERQNRF